MAEENLMCERCQYAGAEVEDIRIHRVGVFALCPDCLDELGSIVESWVENMNVEEEDDLAT